MRTRDPNEGENIGRGGKSGFEPCQGWGVKPVWNPFGVAPECQKLGVYGRIPWLLGVLVPFNPDELGLMLSEFEFDGGVKRFPALIEAETGCTALKADSGGNF